jgi:DNA topoisomerase II
MQRELDRLTNQARFVQMIIDNKLSISKKKKGVLMAELKKLGFKPYAKVEDAKKAGEEQDVAVESESEEDAAIGAHDYDYLLGMPLWSLTQERVEKLRRQIGDVELEVDMLIKLSKEDLWKRDLDLFIEEWRTQLDEEHKRKRRINNIGRRASAKVKVAASGPGTKKRKGLGDSDDDDYEMKSKAKKPAPLVKKKEVLVQPKKQGLMTAFMSGKGTEGKNPPARNHDGNSSEVEPDVEEGKFSAAVPDVKKSKPAPKPKTLAVSNDSDEEVIAKPAARKARAAASKPIQYGLGSEDSDESNGDDLLGDITNMVKGLPGTNAEATKSSSANSKSLFSASTSRAIPNDSTNLKHSAPAASAKNYAELSDDDDTNFVGLVPQQSPRRSINVTKNAQLTDDAEEDEDDVRPLTTNKSRTTAAAKPSKSAKAEPENPDLKSDTEADQDEEDDDEDIFASKPKARPAASFKPASKAPAKPAAAPKPKPAKKDPVPKKAKPAEKAPAPAKKAPLSPAAKAYAAKQAKNLKKNMVLDSSDEEDGVGGGRDRDGEIDAMADDLLDSPVPPRAVPAKSAKPAVVRAKPAQRKKVVESEDEDVGSDVENSPPVKKSAAGGGRPARRAAAVTKKPVYIVSDDDGDGDSGFVAAGRADDESEDDFDGDSE